MEVTKDVYANCWLCENMVAHPEQVGLMHLGFPRCFILVRDNVKFFGALDFDEFMNDAVVEVNWLDPSERCSQAEKDHVLELLWNFSIEQEKQEVEFFNNMHEYD